jgi:DNA-binding XRE family transcriptional regulator
MDSAEFLQVRQSLAKTQSELARLLCVSPRAIQSFEQGWRNIPASVERQLLLILSFEKSSNKVRRPCWETQDCPMEWKENCAAWEYKAGQLCWFINGTFCQGKAQENWGGKIKLCRQCKVFQSMLPGV